MRFFVFILFAAFASQSIGRPQHIDYNNDNNIDEVQDEDNETADDTVADDEDIRLYEQESAAQEEEMQGNRGLAQNRYLQRDATEDRLSRSDADNFSDYKPNTSRGTNSNYQIRTLMKTRQSDKYMDSNDSSDTQESAQHLLSRDINKARAQNVQDDQNLSNKGTAEFDRTLNEEGDMIFRNNKKQVSNVGKSENDSDERLDASEQGRYIKRYYNTIKTENGGIVEDKNQDFSHYYLRDRRDTKGINQLDITKSNNDDIDKSNSEDEESAIKRHIKKLSGNEIEQLLNSLSEEKRDLLKKVINEVETVDNGLVNKREITKKSGAIEDNNFVESSQSDLSKVQGSASVDVNSEFPATQNAETTDATKQTESQTESNDRSSSKTAITNNDSCNNKAEFLARDDEVVQKKSEINTNLDSKNQAEVAANEQITSKTENKRETNLEDWETINTPLDDTSFMGDDYNYSNDKGYFCSPDENLSKFLDDEDRKTYKREVHLNKEADLTDSMKLLEESFPKSSAYDASAPYSGPLIRVKRKSSDQIIQKRSAVLIPDTKVAYVPYKAENEDEDNDEGNEFDDEGFYDRTSNFANNNNAVKEDMLSDSVNSKPQRVDMDDSKSSNRNPESDTMSVGSDTDNVLSGVEGVDDNLMYNSGLRSRRTAEDNSNCDNSILSKSMHSTSLSDNLMKSGANSISLPHYQENDAFGPLPRSYEGELGRYKRIRQVMQSHNSDDPASNVSV